MASPTIDGDARKILEEFIKENRKLNFRARLATIGVICLALAFALFVSVAMTRINGNTDLIYQAQESLKVTCKASDNAALSARVKEDCDRAENNQFVEQVQVLPAIDEPDPNDPENQEPEIQNPEIQDSEINDPDLNDPEIQEDEIQDPDTQEDEIQDPEIQDSEIQDPEIDDPSIPGPAGPPGEPGPSCPPQYTLHERFVEGNPLSTEDDETWIVCVRNDG